jgi:predicted ester cyclase
VGNPGQEQWAARQPGHKPRHGLSLAEVLRKSEQPIKRTEESLMASITAVANDFFAACETGKGWEVCKTYCTPNATFAAQAEPLAEIKTLAEYADWMKGLMTIMPDGSYEVKSFATDAERNNVVAYAVFSGTHTGPGGPCEPTCKKTTSDYVYVMQFTGDKISHMTKIWHSGMALKELGWV